MEKVIIFGAGVTGRMVFRSVSGNCEVIGFLDNDKTLWGTEVFSGIQVLGNADCLSRLNGKYDKILIGTNMGFDVLYKELTARGIAPEKIDRSYITATVQARINFLRDYASMCDDAPGFDVAEGGGISRRVCKGNCPIFSRAEAVFV